MKETSTYPAFPIWSIAANIQIAAVDQLQLTNEKWMIQYYCFGSPNKLMDLVIKHHWQPISQKKRQPVILCHLREPSLPMKCHDKKSQTSVD